MGGHPDKRKRFAREYLIDHNGAQAAIRAGYSPKAAKEIACFLLTKTNVKAEVARLQAQQATAAGLTRESIINEIRRIAFADLSNYFDDDGNLARLKDLPLDVRRALASCKVLRTNLVSGDGARETVHEVKLWDKGKALELAAKILGLTDQRIEHDVEIVVRWQGQDAINITPTKIIEGGESPGLDPIPTQDGTAD